MDFFLLYIITRYKYKFISLYFIFLFVNYWTPTQTTLLLYYFFMIWFTSHFNLFRKKRRFFSLFIFILLLLFDVCTQKNTFYRKKILFQNFYAFVVVFLVQELSNVCCMYDFVYIFLVKILQHRYRTYFFFLFFEYIFTLALCVCYAILQKCHQGIFWEIVLYRTCTAYTSYTHKKRVSDNIWCLYIVAWIILFSFSGFSRKLTENLCQTLIQLLF